MNDYSGIKLGGRDYPNQNRRRGSNSLNYGDIVIAIFFASQGQRIGNEIICPRDRYM